MEARSTNAAPAPPDRKTPNVRGGDARIRNTRIPVWLLVSFRKGVVTDNRPLGFYPQLTAPGLAVAWWHYAEKRPEIAAIRAEEDA